VQQVKRLLRSPFDGSVYQSTVVFDLDGTLSEFSETLKTIGVPMKGSQKMMLELYRGGWKIIVHSARPVKQEEMVRVWLKTHGFGGYVSEVKCGKPLADAYVDDRAVLYEGSYIRVMGNLVKSTDHIRVF